MKKLFSILLAAMMLLSLAACSGGEELRFATGGAEGTYYGFGSVLAAQASGVTVTAITSGGSQANIQSLQTEDVEMGFVQTDVMAYAYSGTNLFAETGAVTNFSTVAALYMEPVQIVTCDPEIKSVADLAGKTVSVGDAGSGVFFNAVDILAAYDIDVEEDINAVYESFGTSAESLQDGRIDAAFIVAGAPTSAVSTLAAQNDVYLVSLDEEHIDALIADSPYYSEYVIASDVYGTESDCTTVAVGAVVIARDDVSEDAIYAFVSGIFENAETIAANHAKGNELDLDFAASVTTVPYHPGAARYFAEKGYDVPVK